MFFILLWLFSLYHTYFLCRLIDAMILQVGHSMQGKQSDGSVCNKTISYRNFTLPCHGLHWMQSFYNDTEGLVFI